MDRALYVGMTGAVQTMQAQAANNNNLANANTDGFRAQLVDAQAMPVYGTGLDSRVNVLLSDQGWDSTQGTIEQTGNPLDIAMAPDAWLAVQASDGSEAYTKGGALHLDPNGQLLTADNRIVLGDSGPVTLPPNTSVTIGGDGTISIVPAGSAPSTLAAVSRLKIVQATPSQLVHGADGLMRARPGVVLDTAPGQVLTAGALEGSNVNLASTMVTMIQLARQFDLQTKLMQTADNNAQASSTLVRMSGA